MRVFACFIKYRSYLDILTAQALLSSFSAINSAECIFFLNIMEDTFETLSTFNELFAVIFEFLLLEPGNSEP